MHAIVAESSDQLVWQEVPDVSAGPGEVLIKVAAAGVNRADVLQAAGKYPPPPGASEIIGMEVSGVIAQVGSGVAGWSVGQEVCALLSGGGYAEYVAVPAGQVMPIRVGVDVADAAGLPSKWRAPCLVEPGDDRSPRRRPVAADARRGQRRLETHAIQVARALGARGGGDRRIRPRSQKPVASWARKSRSTIATKTSSAACGMGPAAPPART